MAPRDVTPGTPFEKAIMDAINRAHIFILVYSSSSNDSKHVQNEVREAWKRGIPIIPFRIQDVPMSDVILLISSCTGCAGTAHYFAMSTKVSTVMYSHS